MTYQQYKYEVSQFSTPVANEPVSVINGNKNKTDMTSFSDFMNRLNSRYEGTSGSTVDHYLTTQQRKNLSLKFTNRFLKEHFDGDVVKFYGKKFARLPFGKHEPRKIIAALYRLYVIEGFYDNKSFEAALLELVNMGAAITRKNFEPLLDEHFFTA